MNPPLVLLAILFLAAMVSAAGLLPLITRWCSRRGLVDDPGERKLQVTAVPLSGGLAVFAAIVLPILVVFPIALVMSSTGRGGSENWINGRIHELFAHRGLEMAMAFAGAAGMFVLGLLDDKHELRPGPKFAGQLIVATLVTAAGVRITSLPPIFGYVVTVLWIVAIVNAFNLVDNMNGLCAGLGFIGAAGSIWIFCRSGDLFGAIIAALLCGALLGFLPRNYPAATTYLGDSGSHLAGYFMAVLSILASSHARTGSWCAAFRPVAVVAVPILDLGWVVCARSMARKPFYIGDRNHLSHLLVRRGLSPAMAVLVLWVIAAAAGALAIICV